MSLESQRNGVIKKMLLTYFFGPASTLFIISSFVLTSTPISDANSYSPALYHTATISLLILSILGVLVTALDLKFDNYTTSMVFSAVHLLMASAFAFVMTFDFSKYDSTETIMLIIIGVIWLVYVVAIIEKIMIEPNYTENSDRMQSISLGLMLSMTFLMFCAYNDASEMIVNGTSYHSNGMEMTTLRDTFLIMFAGLLASSLIVFTTLKMNVVRVAVLFTIVAVAISAAGGYLYYECENMGFFYDDLVLVSLGIVVPLINLVVNWRSFAAARSTRRAVREQKRTASRERSNAKNIRNIVKTISAGEAKLAKLNEKGKLFE